MFPFKESAKQIRKDFSDFVSDVKDFFDPKDEFETFIKSSNFLNFPSFLSLSKNNLKKYIKDQRKTCLVFLYNSSLGVDYLRSVMCNPEIVDMIRSSFPFFADFQDSERGQRAINRLNHGQPFVLGLFSNEGALSVRQNQCSLAETLTFLRNHPNNYPRSPKARNSNQNHRFEDEDAIFQQQLQEALERSRADEVRIKREEDQRENFFRDPDEDELEKVIALSKIEHDEKVREEELLKQAILESQASYHQPELEDNYAELEQALEISKNENYRHSESVMIRNMQDVEYRDAQDRALEQERIKNEKSLEKEKEKNRKQEEVKEKMKLLGEEPGLVPETCIVKFVLPNGQRIERRFYVNSEVVLLYYFIEMKGFENFELLTGFPLKFIRDGTIDSNGLKAGGLCHVRLNA